MPFALYCRQNHGVVNLEHVEEIVWMSTREEIIINYIPFSVFLGV